MGPVWAWCDFLDLGDGPLRRCMESGSHFCQNLPTFDPNGSRNGEAEKHKIKFLKFLNDLRKNLLECWGYFLALKQKKRFFFNGFLEFLNHFFLFPIWRMIAFF